MRLTLALILLAVAAPAARAQDECPGFLPQIACAAPADPAAIAAYEGSWLHRTLAFQHRIGDTLPLVNAPWVGTHNSANSTSESPTLSGADSNQMLSLTDQLRLDVRSLELDIHFAGGVPRVCHARGADQGHAGCTTERTLAERLPEIRDWLDAHPREVVLLYLEDHLQGGGYDPAAAVLEEALGPKLYRPPPGTCTSMPMRLSRRQVLAAGKQVLAISSCGEGTAWQGLIFDDAPRAEFEGNAGDFDPAACGYTGHFQRYYEDSTALSYGAGGFQEFPALTPEVTGQMWSCGVDLLGFDQLLPGDGRLAALAWSWAQDQPAGPGCAVQRARWRIVSCAGRRAFACRGPGRSITVDPRRGPWSARPSGCRRALPRTGYEAARLRATMADAGVKSVWLRHRRSAVEQRRP